MCNFTLIIKFPLHISLGHSIFCSKRDEQLHINEIKIETMIVDSGSLSKKEIQRIQAHLKECTYCKDIYNTFEKMYNEIENEISNKPTLRDKLIAKKIFKNLLQSSASKSAKKK
jgi:hypothetical protein